MFDIQSSHLANGLAGLAIFVGGILLTQGNTTGAGIVLSIAGIIAGIYHLSTFLTNTHIPPAHAEPPD